MATAAERQVRISRVAGRYLVFDIDDVVFIRRHHGICAVLTGTMPQNPTQNLFLSLPVELHAEEAKLLVDKGAGYIADELAQHLSQLGTMDEATRKGYLQHLKQQRRNAQQVFEEAKAEAKAKVQAKHQGKRKAKPAATTSAAVTESGEDSLSLFDDTPPPTTTTPAPAVSKKDQDTTTTTLPSVTPTTSTSLLPASPSTAPLDTALAKYPLYRYLNARGYYTTPGLRFGGDYSVYPGDPFRYHAHYLANSYGWDEEVAMLDLVTSGRLGTAVKKGFLFGAEKPGGGGEKGEGEVRVFCIEWAGM